jgi:AraC-like DNA-binding protein
MRGIPNGGEVAMAVVYSTDDVHPRDALSYWVEVVTRGFVKYAVTPPGGRPFRARVRAGLLGSLGISDYECDPHEVGRSAKDIRHADDDDFFVCLQRSGRSTHFQDDRHAVIEDGDFFLLDPRRPFAGRFEKNGKIVSVRVPRQDLEARLGNAADLACRTLDAQGPVAALAFGFLTMLPERIDGIEGPAASKIADQALDLVALAFSAETQTRPIAVSSRRTVALNLLKGCIEARLHDPDFKPAVAAAAAGISVRYANSLLAQEDTGLERYIIGRRLERCRRALDDPAQAHRMIGEIAFSWGFADLSHFARRFKGEFGCAPGEYRRRRYEASSSK